MLAFLFGCSNVSLNIIAEGVEFNPTTAYYGASYILLLEEPLSCQDMYWVQRTNLDGETPPYDNDLKALQITFNSDEGVVFKGSHSLGGTSAIKSEILGISGEEFSVVRATEGLLDIDELEDDSFVTGGFDFLFPTGSISGSFEKVPWCINIKP